MTVFDAVGWFSKRLGIFSAKAFTVAPTRQNVFVNFAQTPLMKDSLLITIIRAGGSEAPISAWEGEMIPGVTCSTFLGGREVVVIYWDGRGTGKMPRYPGPGHVE